jgi:glycosyltransferase involved in cell wall biosynthesis
MMRCLAFGSSASGSSETVKILFVIPGLGPGGAERVASLLSNFWAALGHNVTLSTFETNSAEPFYALHRDVFVAQQKATLGGSRGGGAPIRNIRRIYWLRELIRELGPDIVIAFMTEANVITLCACFGLGVPVVVSERNQPDRPGLGRAHRLARNICYRFADAIVVQTEPIAGWARSRFRVPVHVIQNPVLLDSYASNDDAMTSSINDGHWLVSVGRLAQQKGFDVLIKSFAASAINHPDWQLVIYGEGPERSVLEGLRRESGVGNRISLPGLTKNVSTALRGASLFALPSRFEGYSNVLLEALACGLPVIATACPGGNQEILANGAYGVLVPPDDVRSMTAALDAMMSAANLRAVYSRRAREAVDELDVAKVGVRWLQLFGQLTAKSGLFRVRRA